MIGYRVDVLIELKKCGYNTNRIRKEKLLGEGTLQNLREGKLVSMATLGKICNLLKCEPGDILCRIYYNDRER